MLEYNFLAQLAFFSFTNNQKHENNDAIYFL